MCKAGCLPNIFHMKLGKGDVEVYWYNIRTGVTSREQPKYPYPNMGGEITGR